MILRILLFTTSIICLDLQALTPQEVQTFINNNFPNGVARNPGQGRNIGNRATQFAQELGGEYGIQVPAALRDTIIKLLKNLGGNKDSSELIQQIADGTPNSPLAAAAAPAAAPRPRPRPRPRPINNPSPQPDSGSDVSEDEWPSDSDSDVSEDEGGASPVPTNRRNAVTGRALEERLDGLEGDARARELDKTALALGKRLRERRAAIKIQAHARGWMTRKRLKK